MNIQFFNVKPSIPEPLRFLEELSYNMWWCWHHDAIDLFRRIDPQVWRECGHNPLVFLGRVPQKRLETLAEDEAYRRHLQKVQEHFQTTVRPDGVSDAARNGIAYFSLEYGIHESIRIYSGGLGVLAGDHLKAVSDMGLPLVAVGLMYRDGYFQQYLNSDGWQQESYRSNQIQHLPIRPAGGDANPMRVSLPLPAGVLQAAVWRMDIGRVPLFLLDTNIQDNPPEFRNITGQLYGGGREMRLQQELLLGIGGFKALVALGYDPSVCHINEGHAAFLSLARMAHIMKTHGLALGPVKEIVRRTNVFTTHTPVPAGNETFSLDLLRPYLRAMEPEINIPVERIVAWGQTHNERAHGELSLTVLGLNMAHHANGVSLLHGRVARRMWQHLWPGRTENEVPIQHITNGIHVPSWLSPHHEPLFERYLGPDWWRHPDSSDIVAKVDNIPDDELWRAHELCRTYLIRLARERLQARYEARNATRAEIAQTKSVLDHDALTIGFARRFATYKRGALLLRNKERLESLLTDESRPIQFIFAGKAHPADDHGKDLIKQIVRFAQDVNIRRHIIFLEDYDIGVARALVQGVDVWLNTPRRPLEASGTSGMKVAANGGLNLSVLDGWWCEGYHKDCGWAIGNGEEYEDADYQDSVESHALFNLLENDVIPSFYDRPFGDLPATWVRMMKASIRMGLGFFTSHRMVAEYNTAYYTTAASDYETLMADEAARAKALVAQHERLWALWERISIQPPMAEEAMSILHVGDRFNVTSSVELGELTPDEVDVQVCYGPVDAQNQIVDCRFEKMTIHEDQGGGRYLYKHELGCRASGRYGFTTRITATGTDWSTAIPGFVTWSED